MADISTYRRCVESHAVGSAVFTVGTVLAASNPVVTQNPLYWEPLTDAEATGGDLTVSGGE